MKIGVTVNLFDNGYGRFGEDIYNKVKEHGFSAVDFSMADESSVLYTNYQGQIESILVHHKQLAEAADVEIYQAHGPWRYPPKDDDESQRDFWLEKMKKAIYFTSLLGCKNFVVHPLIPNGFEDLDNKKAKSTYKINYAFFTELLDTAKDFGVTICLENMPWSSFSLSKPEAILKLVKDIKDDNFQICLDTGHVNVIPKLNLLREVKRLGEHIKAIHVHDNVARLDSHLFPLYGNIDFIGFADALKSVGFDGAFSLETGPSHKLPTSVFEDMSKSLNEIAKYIISE